MSVAGVCVVRDAIDIVPYLCGHYLRAGFARLAFIDDGSSDGTFEFLQNVSKRTHCVSVRQVHRTTFDQHVLVTESANALIADGFPIIVPFDADEFWMATARDFEQRSASDTETIFQGQWVNFVQARTCEIPGPTSLLRMVYRPRDNVRAHREGTTGYTAAFVTYVETKIAFKAAGTVHIDTGQHNVVLRNPVPPQPLMEIFHLPLRSKRELEKRAFNYEPRRAPVRPNDEASWQSAFHRQAILVGKLEEVWAANSFDTRGRLNVYGSPLALVRDTRLRGVLLRAAWHLFRTCWLLPSTR